MKEMKVQMGIYAVVALLIALGAYFCPDALAVIAAVATVGFVVALAVLAGSVPTQSASDAGLTAASDQPAAVAWGELSHAHNALIGLQMTCDGLSAEAAV